MAYKMQFNADEYNNSADGPLDTVIILIISKWEVNRNSCRIAVHEVIWSVMVSLLHFNSELLLPRL